MQISFRNGFTAGQRWGTPGNGEGSRGSFVQLIKIPTELPGAVLHRKNNWDGVFAASVLLKRCGYSELWECSGALQWTTRKGEEGIWCTVSLSMYVQAVLYCTGQC